MTNQTLEKPVISSQDNSVLTAPVERADSKPKADRRKPLAESPDHAPSGMPRCSHRVRAGRYCRLPVLDEKSGLCFRHASLRFQEADSGDLSAELVCGIDEFRSPRDINHVLGELYKLLAANKISPRRGAVMAYTCNLLLRTLPAIDRQFHPHHQEAQKDDAIVIDIPSACASRAQDAQRAFYAAPVGSDSSRALEKTK